MTSYITTFIWIYGRRRNNVVNLYRFLLQKTAMNKKGKKVAKKHTKAENRVKAKAKAGKEAAKGKKKAK
jgi:hypothetical protein